MFAQLFFFFFIFSAVVAVLFFWRSVGQHLALHAKGASWGGTNAADGLVCLGSQGLCTPFHLTTNRSGHIGASPNDVRVSCGPLQGAQKEAIDETP